MDNLKYIQNNFLQTGFFPKDKSKFKILLHSYFIVLLYMIPHYLAQNSLYFNIFIQNWCDQIPTQW